LGAVLHARQSEQDCFGQDIFIKADERKLGIMNDLLKIGIKA
jgi:hypothetical protein